MRVYVDAPRFASPDLGQLSDLRSENKQGRSRHIPDRRVIQY